MTRLQRHVPNAEERETHNVLMGKSEGRNCLVDPGVEMSVILECIVKELVRWIWTEFIGHRTQDRFEIFEHAKRRLVSTKCWEFLQFMRNN